MTRAELSAAGWSSTEQYGERSLWRRGDERGWLHEPTGNFVTFQKSTWPLRPWEIK